ncbi:hypothetical protein HKX48_002182 [Thoreauomyces humboldtii]|nr:hypothetical protein HKX48_002182 [Thoreauomyces humboldtii]
MRPALPSLVALSAVAVAGASNCSTSDVTYVNVTAPLVQIAQYVDNSTDTFSVFGTVRILDGCTFVVDTFVFLPGYTDTLWYGIGSNRTASMHVWGTAGTSSTVQSGVNAESANYTLGSGIAWSDIDTLILFAPATGLVIASASFPSLVHNATTTAQGTSTSLAVSTTSAYTPPSYTLKLETVTPVAKPKSLQNTAAVVEDQHSAAGSLVSGGKGIGMAVLVGLCAFVVAM